LYNDAVLDVAGAWASENVVPPFLTAGVFTTSEAGAVWLDDSNWNTNNAGSAQPYLLGVITFTAQTVGSSNFIVRVNTQNPENDSNYADIVTASPGVFWIPATINVEQVTVADYRWTGAADRVWSNSTNWYPVSTPGAAHAVVIPGGLSTYPLLDASASVATLTIAAGGQLEIPAAYQLTANSVTNDGRLTLWQDVLNGVQTDFHLYNSTMGVSYYGVEITANGAMNATSVLIKGHQDCTTQGEPGDTANRCYDITPGQAPTDAAIRFYYLADELNGLNATQMAVWHWDTGTMTWTLAGAPTPGGSPPDYYVDVSGIADFSAFVLKDSSTTSPTAVALRDFLVRGGMEMAVGAIGALGVAALIPALSYRARGKRRQTRS
jgi:hypothetical protein